MLIFTRTPYIAITSLFIHELVVRARQLSLCSSVGQSAAPESQGRRFDSCQRAYSCIFCSCYKKLYIIDKVQDYYIIMKRTLYSHSANCRLTSMYYFDCCRSSTWVYIQLSAIRLTTRPGHIATVSQTIGLCHSRSGKGSTFKLQLAHCLALPCYRGNFCCNLQQNF